MPNIEEVQFDGKLVGSLEEIMPKISQLPFYSAKIVNSELVIVRVESRNINKKPYLFHIITVKQQGLSLVYSIPQDTSVTLRRASALKSLTGIVLLIQPSYQIDQSKFLHYIDSVMESLVAGMSQNYNALYNRYDSLLAEYRDIKRLNLELASSNRTLTIKTAELNEQNKVVNEQLSALQKYSDEALMVLVEEWLEVHNNAIDLEEFGKTYNVSMQRLEQILNKMVSMGYVELKN